MRTMRPFSAGTPVPSLMSVIVIPEASFFGAPAVSGSGGILCWAVTTTVRPSTRTTAARARMSVSCAKRADVERDAEACHGSAGARLREHGLVPRQTDERFCRAHADL